MQVIHATFSHGEGNEAVKLLENLGVEIEDYKLIESNTGDLLIINLLHQNVDTIIDRLKNRFDFSHNVNRSLMIFTPDTIIPRNKEKIKDEASRASRETIITYAKDNATISGQLVFLAIVAATIASLGLILDNTPVIVGAMIIAPVFGPIAGMAIGVVLGDMKLFAQGFVAELVVMAIAVGVGLAFGIIIPNVSITHALQVRMLPTLADLLVALAAGAAGAYSLIKRVASQQLVGVVIAAALIPVMATIGIGISLGNLGMIRGATLLLLGNFFSLLLAIILVFYIKGLKPQWWYASTAEKMIKRSLAILVVSVVVLSLPLSTITYQQMVAQKPEDIVREAYYQVFDDSEEARLVSIDIEDETVAMVIYAPASTEPSVFETLSDRLREELGQEYQIIFEIITTQRLITP